MDRKRPTRGRSRVTRIETIMTELELYATKTSNVKLTLYTEPLA
jgi:hypothetical protein